MLLDNLIVLVEKRYTILFLVTFILNIIQINVIIAYKCFSDILRFFIYFCLILIFDNITLTIFLQMGFYAWKYSIAAFTV